MSFSRLNRGVEVLDHRVNVGNEEDVVEFDHGSSLMRRLVRRGANKYVGNEGEVDVEPETIDVSPLHDVVDGLEGEEIGGVDVEDVVEGDVDVEDATDGVEGADDELVETDGAEDEVDAFDGFR